VILSKGVLANSRRKLYRFIKIWWQTPTAFPELGNTYHEAEQKSIENPSNSMIIPIPRQHRKPGWRSLLQRSGNSVSELQFYGSIAIVMEFFPEYRLK
jgi:hypothetical protein